MFVLLISTASVGEGLQAGRSRVIVPNASLQRVVTMLDDLITEMDNEQKLDDKMHEGYQSWCAKQQAATSISIASLTSQIEELTARLAKLYAHKGELEDQISSLNEQIQVVQTAIQVATEKRNEEHNTFVTEQQNFDASISACGRAVEILKTHYGEPAAPLEKPSWMSLAQSASTVRRVVEQRKMTLSPDILSFLSAAESAQQPQSSNRYTDKRGESMSIVTQMQELSDTFATDKQSSINEENRLQEMFSKLMAEKTTLLNTLISERDARQKILNQVNQAIATAEGAKAAAEAELADEQAYLSQIQKSCADAKALYANRKQDRADETLACNEAKKVLAGQLSLLEVGSVSKRVSINKASGQRVRAVLRIRQKCPNCGKASAFLLQAARAYSSQVLAAAASTMTQNDAVQDVIRALDGLVAQLHKDQDMEDQHKDWCETELSETNTKKAHHEILVESLTATIADLTATIAEKKQALVETAEAIQLADTNFQEATAIRRKEKADFETELENYKNAIAALNTAVDILAKFYASKGAAASLLQIGTAVAPRDMAPGVFSNVYEQKGGSGVIGMISTVRKEFEAGQRDLEAGEKQTQADYDQAKEDYQNARRDLVSQGDRLTVEQQTAETEMEQALEDKASNEEEVAAAKAYLLQLGGSCNMLLKNYDDRKKQRNEEESAIEQAKKVLQEEA